MDRPHGLGGGVIVDLISDRVDRLSKGSELDSDVGLLHVVSARPHGRRWLVQFDGFVDRDGADKLRGVILRAEPEADAEGLWVHEVIGLEVVDIDGVNHGAVAAIQANPAHDLLVLDDGTLVPAVFIVSTGTQIVVDVPEGLF